jgi:hypothetical protein
MGLAPKADRPLPMLGYDLAALERDVGTNVVRRIQKSDFEWQKSRRLRDLDSEKHISFEVLEELIGELERQVIAFCAG